MGSDKSEHIKLNQWFATSICGNDILSSCLYVSGIAVTFGGIFAPIVLAIIVGVLYLYKHVYTEVVEALPVNGGAYNCLLNGTSKTIAAIAGVTTILSYIATCVLSATVSVEYLKTVVNVPLIAATIGLLLFFAILVIAGLKDSAKVALGIFSLHVVSLVVFVFFGIVYFIQGHHFLIQNIANTAILAKNEGGILKAFFFAFSASLLGVSGFESSANFVEEQKRGVFRKTLKNMLIGVGIFNPLIALIVLGVSPISTIVGAKDFLLADEALIMGGHVFQYFIVIDAFLVLAGAVLTSFVGVSGLVYRMASDACLPEWLTKQNKKGSYPLIIIAFFILCTSILLITNGDLLSLAGVYTIAFLSVMSLFALGNLILKQTRTELKRTYKAPALFALLAFSATFAGIVGNILINPNNFLFFSIYFIPAVAIVLAMVYEDFFLKVILRLTKNIKPVHRYVLDHFHDITGGQIAVFVNHISRFYATLEYINRNETAQNITLIHCRNWDLKSDKERYEELKAIVPVMKKAGAFSHFKINFFYEDLPFGPEAVEDASKKLRIRKNRILIGSLHNFHSFEYSDLGGVRIIF